MTESELEQIVHRAIVRFMVDRVLEKLAISPSHDSCHLFVHAPVTGAMSTQTAVVLPAVTQVSSQGKRIFGWKDAVQYQTGQTLKLGLQVVITPLAADELTKRQIKVIRE